MKADKSKIIILLPIIFITATVSRVSLLAGGRGVVGRCWRVGVLTPTERWTTGGDTAQCPMVPAHWRQHTGHRSSAPHRHALLHSWAVTALNNSKNDAIDKQIGGKKNAQMHIYLSNLEDDIGRSKSLFSECLFSSSSPVVVVHGFHVSCVSCHEQE